MYAIIEDSGTQIKVSEGDVIRIAARELPADAATVTFDRVLLVGGTEGEAKIGQPNLPGAKVTADVLGEGRTDKVSVVKFRRRKTYKRMKGHRQDYMQVKVTSIQA
ncbi:MAG: 50S ribosomal protein L21 [Phycisphaeraceae bacterium]|nr:50S ribosomal protein L21 [Phycisphaeraceae bacterium]